MKVAILSESAADEAAIRHFVEGLLGARTEVPGNLPIRSRGWPAVRDNLATVLRHLHYRSDCEALARIIHGVRFLVESPRLTQLAHYILSLGGAMCMRCELTTYDSYSQTDE